jgi:hypothetical protein
VRHVTPGLHAGLDIIRETRGNEVGVLGAGHIVFQVLDEAGAPPRPSSG